MKYALLLRRTRFILTALALLCATVIGVNLWRISAVNSNKEKEAKLKFHANVREGVGSEVKLAKPDDDEKNIRASINSLAHFISTRSGVKLSGHTKNRLAEMEATTLRGTTRRITADELTTVLAATATERVKTLSDAEIERAAVTLGGFDAPDLPAALHNGRQKVRLRASTHSDLTREEFVSQVKAVRNADEASSALFKGAARNVASAEVKDRVEYLSEALPEQFSPAAGFTPAQVVLIAYSVASDDYMTYSEANLRKRMKSAQQWYAKKLGSYPNSDGHFAYGPNGYNFSTPLDLIFDETTLDILLDKIAERSVPR